ncbi:hypothetical protein PMAYCL1PPCAC_17699 [Pristionchus mayeri]|uniref:FAM65 N-terminal domain-containing protein n=1 Tax=Pristionchus mayeri TaxID=1317129 RepID=A0AAN5I0P3_9BILA|nr:hypothetical protein PMAYCL1PPCAC_17699 [Pristionchus mayeri]
MGRKLSTIYAIVWRRRGGRGGRGVIPLSPIHSSTILSLPTMLKHSTTKRRGDGHHSMTGLERGDDGSEYPKEEEGLISARPSPHSGRSLQRSPSQESSMYTHTLPRHMGHRMMREWDEGDDPLKFSTLQAPKASKFQKRKEEQRRRGLMAYESQGSPYLSGTLSRSSMERVDRSMLLNGPSSQADHIIVTTRNAYNQLHSFLADEAERLSIQIEEATDDARRSGLNQEYSRVRESREKCDWYLSRLIKLAEMNTRARVNAAKAKSSSLSDLRASIVGSKPVPVIDPSIEKELGTIMGSISLELKGVVGFARVTPGDVFEVSIKHSTSKWKGKGKTQQDRNQKWDRNQFDLRLVPSAPIDVKVAEVGLFKSRVLCERSFDPCELLSPQPQLLTLNLNSIGSIKLQVVVTWLAPLSTTPTATSLSISSSQSSDSTRKPRVLLREKKRGGAVRAAIKSEWRSSTNILDDLYSDISKTIPSMDEMSSSRGTMSSTRSPLSSMNRRSLSLAHLSSLNDCPLSSSSSEESSRSVQFHLSQLISLSQSVESGWNEMVGLTSLLKRWHRVLQSRSVSRGRSMHDDIDDNVLISSEDDSGVDSLRGVKRDDRRRKREDSTVSLSEDMTSVLNYHLKRVERGLTKLKCLPRGPLVYKTTQLLRGLQSERITLSHLLNLSADPTMNLSNLLIQLDSDPEVHEIWLSTAFPLRASYILPVPQLRDQLQSRVSLLVNPLYPPLSPRVTSSLLNLLSDSLADESTNQTTVFHFVSLFRDRPFCSFVENLSHETWMLSLLFSGRSHSISLVMERLSIIPLAPPLETLSSIASLLCNGSSSAVEVIQEYLETARGQKRVDLLSSFLCLLENDDDQVRLGSLVVLAILRNDRISEHLRFVRDYDSSATIRKEADRLLQSIGDNGETTRI